ncbi:MAG: hypothetical protein RH859_02960 [Longimicrobiales bacterium]
MSPGSRAIALVGCLFVGVHGPLGAQQVRAPAASTEARADSILYTLEDPAAALSLLESALRSGRDAYPLRWRAARAATALSVVHQEQAARRASLLRVAIDHGEAAVAARPEGIDGRYWRVAAKGRLSLHADSRAAAALARQIEAEARDILARDSLHAGGHNALGRLNLEVMILPGWKRSLGRLLSGDVLGRTSWDLAEHHLQRAVELEPGNPLYLRDLGALHHHRDRPTAARILLRRVVALEGLHPWERVFQDEARTLLGEIDGSGPVGR